MDRNFSFAAIVEYLRAQDSFQPSIINSQQNAMPSYQDFQIDWTPGNLNLGEMLGVFTYNNIPGITSLNFRQATALVGFDIEGMSDLLTVTFPNLISVDPARLYSSFLIVSNCPLIQAIAFPLLQQSNGGIICETNAQLVNVSIPVFVPFNNTNILFDGCALSAASVNHILARCVLNAGYNSGLINLSGGTSAAPTGQGIVDKATLIGRGVGVNTN